MGTTSENTTKYVSFLLDETGSMKSIKEDTIGGFNEYVDTLKEDGDNIAFSLVSFNSNGTKSRYVAEPIEALAPLTNENYRPAAMTPLIDASVKIIKATAKAVKKRKDDPLVLVVIQTDGYENCSRKHTFSIGIHAFLGSCGFWGRSELINCLHSLVCINCFS